MSSIVDYSPYQGRFARTFERAAVRKSRIDWLAIGLLAIHPPLALLISQSSEVSTIHGILIGVVGVFVAIQSRRRPERVAYLGAYIVGAEVLWRMTGSQLFWEYGKYATSAIFLLSMAVNRKSKLPRGALIYFALLIPSTLLTVSSVGGAVPLQKALSFYMSGPLALAVSWCFFSQLQLTARQMERVLLSLVCPTLGVATVAILGTLTATSLKFTDESNFATSGGFGPNQVSGALALGAVCALIWLLANNDGWLNRALIFCVLAILATQAALTFSRGGLYNAVGSSAVALYFLLRDRQSRVRVVMAVGLIVLVAVFVIVPRLEEFTGGALTTRFKNVDVANRDTIVRSDLVLFQEHPILGVGPGMAAAARRMPHTEISRLLAEHGLFGLGALLVLLLSAFVALRRAATNRGKALSGALVTFSLLFMLDKAMRLAAPAFAFGFAFVTLIPDEKQVTRCRPTSKRRPGVRARRLRSYANVRAASRRNSRGLAGFRELPATGASNPG